MKKTLFLGIMLLTIAISISSIISVNFAQDATASNAPEPSTTQTTESPEPGPTQTTEVPKPTLKPINKPKIIKLKTSITPVKSKIKRYTQKSFNKNYFTNLVNKYNRLPKSFKPKEPVFLPSYVKCRFNYLRMNKTAAENLKHMFDDATKDGITLIAYSTLRTRNEQITAFKRKVRYYKTTFKYDYEKAYKYASRIVAIPDSSEHQTGLAIDIVSNTYGVRDSGFAKSAAGKWLKKNSYKYGFTYRYQKAHIKHTYIVDEPWHYRYVGKKLAKKLFKKDICLEEYYKL